MLAPLTNKQSGVGGVLSDDEFKWLTMRSQGGFGLTMTCASHVQVTGKGFEGQLGCFGDHHLAGLARLAAAIKRHGSVAVLQLHHAGRRSPPELIGGVQPVCPWDDPKTGSRALTTAEVEQLVRDFVVAAVRCEAAGFDGVEVHGAHDYIICEFLSTMNRRTDRFGGSLENRSRVLFDIIAGIRAAIRPDFHLAVRLSTEKYGLKTLEMASVFDRLAASGQVDLIDLSLWDAFKSADDPELSGAPLLETFAQRPRGSTRLAVAGKIYSGDDARRVLAAGADVVAVGRAAVTNHDFPELIRADPQARMRALPVSRGALRAEGLGEAFVEYMATWPGFVAEDLPQS
jgi:2,4-dienoyl-CoA reductase-like NADH-dependent reductase (Old Yellow Enzyme family)